MKKVLALLLFAFAAHAQTEPDYSTWTRLLKTYYDPARGMNYGALFTAWGVAGIVGPFIAARVYQATGSYSYAFYGAAGLAFIAFVSLSFARPPLATSRRPNGSGGRPCASSTIWITPMRSG